MTEFIRPCRIYVLRCNDRSLYCGVAYNPYERLKKHNAGKGSKYVRSRLPAAIVVNELCHSYNDALKAEAAFKKLRKAKKEKYVRKHLMEWAAMCGIQDECENAPFATVGGLDKRSCMVAPLWIPASDHESFLKGYREWAREYYGEDWETCEFNWKPAITINGDKA